MKFGGLKSIKTIQKLRGFKFANAQRCILPVFFPVDLLKVSQFQNVFLETSISPKKTNGNKST
jgi:hypothetical protein